MDLTVRTRCKFCEAIFCCPSHRRKHENVSHGSRNNRQHYKTMTSKPIDSYALGMRKSFLYLEEKKTTIDGYSRKRKYVNITLIEKSTSRLDLKERKILVPVSRKREKSTLLNEAPQPKAEQITPRDLLSPNLFTVNKHDMVTELISPVEHTSIPDDGLNFVSPTDKYLLDPAKIFTTSTPIMELANKGISTPLQSAKKSAMRVGRGLAGSHIKRKVTFSETVDSLYTTATDEQVNAPSRGIFSSVANAFQTAITTIAGMSDGNGEMSMEDEWSFREANWRRNYPKLLKTDALAQERIKGRRPLYTDRPRSKLSLYY